MELKCLDAFFLYNASMVPERWMCVFSCLVYGDDSMPWYTWASDHCCGEEASPSHKLKLQYGHHAPLLQFGSKFEWCVIWFLHSQLAVPFLRPTTINNMLGMNAPGGLRLSRSFNSGQLDTRRLIPLLNYMLFAHSIQMRDVSSGNDALDAPWHSDPWCVWSWSFMISESFSGRGSTQWGRCFLNKSS